MRTVLAFALGFSLLAGLPLAAQETRGTISGTVQDQQGVIPGAAVKITNVETAVSQQVITNSSGLLRSAAVEGGKL